ncbi:MAG: dihydroneopterin aldolase, partial [Actinobacteria bacterium]|nr:dihydroneopterin aldolase [Actinomycetota bacterium]
MSDQILITGITAKGFHGVLPEEQKNGQIFIVDLELNMKLIGLKDKLSKTVNYAEVAKLVETEIAGDPVKLIETLAERIGKMILKKFTKVKSARVIVHKPSAPIPVKIDDVAVSVLVKR